MLANLVLLAVFLLVLAIAITAVMHLFLRVPYVPTPGSVAARMVEAAQLKGDETVMDLGAGTGHILLAAKRLHPGIHAIGCELVPTVWAFGKLRILFSGKEIDFRLANAFHQDLREADVVFVYLLPKMLADLAPKFRKEMKPGSRVISHGFKIPGKEPDRDVESAWGKKHKKHLYIYQY